MFRLPFVVALATLCLSASAQDELPTELPPAEESVALASSASVGMAVYRHDQAASVATDTALALRKFKKDKRVKGWITEQQGEQIVVTFLDDTPAALYRVSVAGGVPGPVVVLNAPTPLSVHESGAASARSAAFRSGFQPCAKTYNSVVLPGTDASEDWTVYLLPATTRSDLVPFGGTYRFGIRDSQVVSQRGFTRTCITLQTGPKVEGLMITHLLDAIPTEAHVFWSLWAKKPIYVATAPNGTVWAVDGDKIRLVKRNAAGD